ncbi:MAG: phosphoribosylanthranilate isomerase [Rhodanobacteraceae bacterium]
MESSARGHAVRTRIKFCGITRTDDARRAVELGVDALGFVFTRSSQRFIGITQARAMRSALPPLVSVVALFMDDEPGWIEEVLASVQPDVLQFHGEETAGFASSFARPYIKSVPMGSIANAARYMADYSSASGFLLDSHERGARGGTGEVFDWSRSPQEEERPIVLAGGLTPANVAVAIAAVRPYAVDVSSGVESAPGIKDVSKMRAFVAAVRAAETGSPG